MKAKPLFALTNVLSPHVMIAGMLYLPLINHLIALRIIYLSIHALIICTTGALQAFAMPAGFVKIPIISNGLIVWCITLPVVPKLPWTLMPCSKPSTPRGHVQGYAPPKYSTSPQDDGCCSLDLHHLNDNCCFSYNHIPYCSHLHSFDCTCDNVAHCCTFLTCCDHSFVGYHVFQSDPSTSMMNTRLPSPPCQEYLESNNKFSRPDHTALHFNPNECPNHLANFQPYGPNDHTSYTLNQQKKIKLPTISPAKKISKATGTIPNQTTNHLPH